MLEITKPVFLSKLKYGQGWEFECELSRGRGREELDQGPTLQAGGANTSAHREVRIAEISSWHHRTERRGLIWRGKYRGKCH